MKNLLHFISHVQSDCSSSNVRVVLSPSKLVDKSRGWFCAQSRRLVVAMDNPLEIWLGVLSHEYCHFEQWRSNSVYFNDAKIGVNEWLEKARKHNSTIDKVRDLELDCERRSYRNIDKFNLPINKSDYIKRAASYIHYYNYLKINPVWYKKPPYEIEEIIRVMPRTLRGNFAQLSYQQEQMYRRHYD